MVDRKGAREGALRWGEEGAVVRKIDGFIVNH